MYHDARTTKRGGNRKNNTLVAVERLAQTIIRHKLYKINSVHVDFLAPFGVAHFLFLFFGFSESEYATSSTTLYGQ